jgi:hypothetical protein
MRSTSILRREAASTYCHSIHNIGVLKFLLWTSALTTTNGVPFRILRIVCESKCTSWVSRTMIKQHTFQDGFYYATSIYSNILASSTAVHWYTCLECTEAQCDITLYGIPYSTNPNTSEYNNNNNNNNTNHCD